MPDDTYRFVLAEQVAEWLLSPACDKCTFEQWGAGLNPHGQALVRAILGALQKQFHPTGNTGPGVRLFLAAETVDVAAVYKAAEEAARRWRPAA